MDQTDQTDQDYAGHLASLAVAARTATALRTAARTAADDLNTALNDPDNHDLTLVATKTAAALDRAADTWLDHTTRADRLREGQTIALPNTGTPETITELWIGNGHVDVHTDKTGPNSAYQWPGDEPITVLPADLRQCVHPGDREHDHAMCLDDSDDADRERVAEAVRRDRWDGDDAR